MRRSEIYIEFANACTDEAYTRLEAQFGWRRSVLNPPIASTALECEQLYRVASLIAYGHTYIKKESAVGLATWKDIEKFCFFSSAESASRLIIELPAVAASVDDGKKSRGTPMPVPSEMRIVYSHISANVHRFSDYETYTLLHLNTDGVIEQRTMAALLGQLVANEFARPSFLGWLNGQPQIEPNDEVGESWVTLASLPDDKAPGLCQGCGKLLDRRSMGGRPALTCGKEKSPACSSRFNNRQRDLVRIGDPAAAYVDTLEQKAREVRWEDDNDGRPLQFPGIHLPIGSDG